MRFDRRNGCWLKFSYILLILAAGCGSQAQKQSRTDFSIGSTRGSPVGTANGSAGDSNHPTIRIDNPGVPHRPEASANRSQMRSGEALWVQAAKADLVRFPDKFVAGSADTFLRADNVTALLLAGGTSVVMHNSDADRSIQDDVRHHRFFNDFSEKSLDLVGYPAFHFSATGLWYAVSAENRDDFNKERALVMMTALSVTGVVTTGLKAVRANDCPNGKSWAWPSGHTSSSFTAAAVLDEFYGPKVGIPAYVLASTIAYRMVETDDHWASDVVFGATLGWVVGHTIAGKHKYLEIAGFKLLPYVSSTEEPATGISLLKRF